MMRLNRLLPPAPQLPLIPLASLTLLIGTCVIVAAMASTSRGPGLRLATADRDGDLDERGAVRVEVSPDQVTTVDGTPVPLDRIGAELQSRLAGREAKTVVLAVAPAAGYETMMAVLGAIESLPAPPRIAIEHTVKGRRG